MGEKILTNKEISLYDILEIYSLLTVLYFSLGKSVVTSVESGTGQETDRLEVEVGSHPYILHSQGTRPVLVVGNNRRPGGLAVYSK